jgi:O-antigen/teichoic acid export membrane protein
VTKKFDDEQRRLYLWVRVVGAFMLMISLVLAVFAIILLPLLHHDYEISDGAVIAILGTLAASALALVDVQLRLWRGGKDE